MSFTLLHTARKASRKLSTVLALTTAFGVGVSLVGAAPAQAGRRDEKDTATYNIKRVYKAGDADKYRISFKMHMDAPQMPVEMSQTMVMKETTKEATDDGASSVASEFESASMTINGMEVDISAMLPKFIVTRDKNGKTDIKTEGGAAEFTAQAGDQVKQFTDAANTYIPKKPVKVGDSWDLDATNFGAVGQNIKGKSTLVSVETVKGRKVGKIKSVMEITAEAGVSMQSETIVLMDMATGKALSVVSKTEGDAAGNKMSMEMSMKMIDPKGDGKEAIKAEEGAAKP